MSSSFVIPFSWPAAILMPALFIKENQPHLVYFPSTCWKSSMKPVFEGLADPFYAVDSRDYQVIQPNHDLLR